MADNAAFDMRKCDSKTLPADIANQHLKGNDNEVRDLLGNCSLPWARKAAVDLQNQQIKEDEKLPAYSWLRDEHKKFRTKEALDDKSYLFQATARRELIDLANGELNKIIDSREKTKS